MLFLTPFFSAELLTEEEIEKIKKLTMEKILEAFNGLYEVAGSNSHDTNINVTTCRGDDGKTYSNVQTQVTGRLTVDGTRWLLAGQVAISMEGLTEMARQSIDYVQSL